MKILHVAKFVDDRANGIRNVVPYHVIEQAKHADIIFQNVMNVTIPECCEYQRDLVSDGWPFNIDNGNFVPDMVVFHGYYHIEMVGLSKKLRKANIPYIVVPHGSLTCKAQHTKYIKKLIGNLLIFNSYRNNALAIQFLSDLEKNRSKVKIRNFIGTNGIYLPAERKKIINREQITFTYIGRLDTHIKGLDLLIDAVSKIKQYLIDNKCVFNLYGPINSAYQKKVNDINNMIQQTGTENIIKIHNAVFDDDKNNILLESDIFIQTSRTEAMPMGILEALSYGIPCLVTEGTTLGGLIEEYDAGWSCDTTAEAIAKAIECAVSEKEQYAKKSENAIKIIEERYLWNKISEDTVKNYLTLINSCGGDI